jgi:hypothetical protein
MHFPKGGADKILSYFIMAAGKIEQQEELALLFSLRCFTITDKVLILISFQLTKQL